MGYRRTPKTYTLTFAEADMNGLQVVMRGLSIGEFLRVNGMGDVDDDNITGMLDLFADKLVSWNLETEDGAPVATTREGVRSQDLDFVLAVTAAWVDAVAGVSGPLEPTSPAGPQFPAVSIPMEPLPSSQQPSPAPSTSSGSAVSSTFSPVAC